MMEDPKGISPSQRVTVANLPNLEMSRAPTTIKIKMIMMIIMMLSNDIEMPMKIISMEIIYAIMFSLWDFVNKCLLIRFTIVVNTFKLYFREYKNKTSCSWI